VLNTQVMWTINSLNLLFLRNGRGLQGLVEYLKETHEEDWAGLFQFVDQVDNLKNKKLYL
jgi:hypothetical protein